MADKSKKNPGAEKKAATRRGGMNSVELDLVKGLKGFLTDLKNDKAIEKKYTCRRVILDLEPQPYTVARVKATRRLLNASQGLFAQFLGVSVKAVRAWEQGRTPGEMACRFMDEIRHNPEYWRSRLKESIKIRTTGC